MSRSGTLLSGRIALAWIPLLQCIGFALAPLQYTKPALSLSKFVEASCAHARSCLLPEAPMPRPLWQQLSVMLVGSMPAALSAGAGVVLIAPNPTTFSHVVRCAHAAALESANFNHVTAPAHMLDASSRHPSPLHLTLRLCLHRIASRHVSPSRPLLSHLKGHTNCPPLLAAPQACAASAAVIPTSRAMCTTARKQVLVWNHTLAGDALTRYRII